MCVKRQVNVLLKAKGWYLVYCDSSTSILVSIEYASIDKGLVLWSIDLSVNN